MICGCIGYNRVDKFMFGDNKRDKITYTRVLFELLFISAENLVLEKTLYFSEIMHFAISQFTQCNFLKLTR